MSSYQDIKHIPSLIDDCLTQQSILTKEIEGIMLENEHLMEEKQKLMIENAVLDERIRIMEEQLQKL